MRCNNVKRCAFLWFFLGCSIGSSSQVDTGRMRILPIQFQWQSRGIAIGMISDNERIMSNFHGTKSHVFFRMGLHNVGIKAIAIDRHKLRHFVRVENDEFWNRHREKRRIQRKNRNRNSIHPIEEEH